MGRTVATMTQLVDQELAAFSRFRRALRREDQEVLDRLFSAARHHAAAGAYQSHASPFETILLAMLLEVAKAVVSHERRLADLAELLAAHDKEAEALRPPAGEQVALPIGADG
ncbi:MAG: hypothetical protein QN122_11135 [Armatimonadota bacterium]|nr:hypothetical protein [Armatimonadota bacterium]MDR7447595.1 hypothetical protein [Armatimonadota bacterium]MDR7459524.1 hypothetical protein [Armatimonadota bacterium]MDR7480502.1 hypothetical protein [Armatimonadota bacterium]MDR7489096.1 hypothetical protein [Armatimonadota bacterium]